MTDAIEFDPTRPALGAHAFDDDLDAIRENCLFILLTAAANNYQVPGWAFTPSGADLSEPDYIEGVLNGGSGVKVKLTFTWTCGDLTSTKYEYDDGTGYTTFTDGTVTNTYSGDDWTGNTSA